jgi:hypothetical protein
MVSGLVMKPKTTNRRNPMTRPKRNDAVINVTKQDLMEMLTEDNAIKVLLQKLLQEVLETEMEEALQAGTWRLILHRVSQSSTTSLADGLFVTHSRSPHH